VSELSPADAAELDAIIASAKELARRYRQLTGRPLGVTGEVAEYEAARVLGLELAPVRSPGYDLIRRDGARAEYLQVKGRVIKNGKANGRLGSIDITKPWDGVLAVLLDEDLNAVAIYESPRERVVAAITKPGSKSRNERHALSVSQFKAISRQVWPTT